MSNSKHAFAPRRAKRPSRCFYLSPERGRGECRVPAAPAASCAKCWWHTSVATTGPPGSPGIPARDGFNGLFRALPGDRALLPPSSADMQPVHARLGRHAFRELDASVGASGPHDFAVRCNRLSSARSLIAHRSFDPPCDPLARQTLPRPPHPIPTFVTMANAPLARRDAGSCSCDLGWMKTGIFLQRGMDTRINKQPDGQITGSSPMPHMLGRTRSEGSAPSRAQWKEQVQGSIGHQTRTTPPWAYPLARPPPR